MIATSSSALRTRRGSVSAFGNKSEVVRIPVRNAGKARPRCDSLNPPCFSGGMLDHVQSTWTHTYRWCGSFHRWEGSSGSTVSPAS